jgi:hypothetical protein
MENGGEPIIVNPSRNGSMTFQNAVSIPKVKKISLLQQEEEELAARSHTRQRLRSSPICKAR